MNSLELSDSLNSLLRFCTVTDILFRKVAGAKFPYHYMIIQADHIAQHAKNPLAVFT